MIKQLPKQLSPISYLLRSTAKTKQSLLPFVSYCKQNMEDLQSWSEQCEENALMSHVNWGLSIMQNKNRRSLLIGLQLKLEVW
jgi:hypothetical protein